MDTSDNLGDTGRPDETDAFDRQATRLSALGDATRRALYRYVAARPDATSRDDAAQAVGVPRHVAKFHLDRLEDSGLLESEYSRPPGRRGPGAGRPAKRYRRADAEISLSLPARRYDLVSQVMMRAIAAAAGSSEPVRVALRDVARAEGRELGRRAVAGRGRRATRAATVRSIARVLDEEGYQPRLVGPTVELANCPFDALAREQPELMCGMNLDLLDGMVEACGCDQVQTRFTPTPGRCCVVVGPPS